MADFSHAVVGRTGTFLTVDAVNLNRLDAYQSGVDWDLVSVSSNVAAAGLMTSSSYSLLQAPQLSGKVATSEWLA